MKKLNILLIVSLLSLGFSLQTQAQSLTVADGKVKDPTAPINAAYLVPTIVANVQHQMIYQSDMLTSLRNATITRIVFYSTDEEAWGNITGVVKLMQTSATACTAFDMLETSSATQVYSGTVAIRDHKMEFNFQTPFTYTGENLLIDIVVDPGTDFGSYDETDPDYFGINSTANSSAFYCDWEFFGEKIPMSEASDFLPKVTFYYGEESNIAQNPTQNVHVYPNPTTGQLTICDVRLSDVRLSDVRLSDVRLSDVRLYDVMGREISVENQTSEIGKSEIQLDISHLPAGIYFLKTGGKMAKVIKN